LCRLLQLDIAALKQEISHLIAIRPFVTEFLAELADQPQQVILVTNAHRKSLNLKLANTGIGNWFDEIVVSHDFRAAKEEQQFWQQLRITHPFDPGRTLLIDDTESVLESAHHYGIKHLLTLLQPDSKQAKKTESKFPGIHHFDEIMPSGI
jgi:HAD superfamily hydrolase (TIGR01509 family)